MIATRKPPGKCRAAQKRFTLVLVRASACGYQYPREKKPSSASTRTTIKMIQRMLMFEPPFGLVVGRLWRRLLEATTDEADARLRVAQKMPWMGQ
jgi:hypothetical protein